jgi:hypothetical protein
LTEKQPRFLAVTIAFAVAAALALTQVALAANQQHVSRASVLPASGGRPAAPKPVQIGFSLSVKEEHAQLRPAPIKTYAIGTEGVIAFPGALPHCSLAQAKPRRGPAKPCKPAQVGSGLIRAAAGLREDTAIASSLPCNLQLRLYNTGTGVALRVDTDTPVPPSFKSKQLGCPVPIHTAIRGSFDKTTIDGLPAMDLRFTLPKLLLRPLEGWEGALQLVDATLKRQTGRARVKGRLREVGYFSAIGCRGGQRTTRAVFIDESGARAEATRSVGC